MTSEMIKKAFFTFLGINREKRPIFRNRKTRKSGFKYLFRIMQILMTVDRVVIFSWNCDAWDVYTNYSHFAYSWDFAWNIPYETDLKVR